MNPSNYTARRAEIVFGQPMNPCPKCGSYHMMIQTPIKMDEPITAADTPKSLLGKWARAQRGYLGEDTPLEGPVFIMCRDCGHKGPSIDCSGRTRGDVGKDPEVAKKVKQLWNSQQT